MKKITKIIATLGLIISLLPQVASADFAVGFSATSTTQGWITPNLVNRTLQTIIANSFIGSFFTGTSTATSTFAGGIQSNILNTTSTTASSTFANGINLIKGCFAINGSCVTGSGGGGAGSVTSVATNNGLTGGTITTTGTLGLDLSKLGSANQNSVLTWNGSQLAATGTPNLTAGLFTATSTTATSTFLGNLMIGNSLFGGTLAPAGGIFNSIPNPFQVSNSSNDLSSLASYGNQSTGSYAAGCLSYYNASSTPENGLSDTNYAADCFTGPNFNSASGSGGGLFAGSLIPGLPANSYVSVVQPGAYLFGALGTDVTKAWMSWSIGSGYSSGNYDMVLKNVDTNVAANQANGGLGIGSTTPFARLSLSASSTATFDYLDVGSTTNGLSGSNSSVFTIKNNGNIGIATATPGTLFSAANINFTTATTTSNATGGIDLKAGCFALRSSCLTLSTLPGNVSLTSQITGTLPVANGGTGNTTFTGANLLYGNGTGSIGSIATTTVTCAGTVACTTFTTLGGTPITLTGSGGGGGAGTYPFTPSTNFAAATNATTGVVWFQNGLQASTTSQFDYATSTAETTGNLYDKSLTTGRVTFATTSGQLVDSSLVTYNTSTNNFIVGAALLGVTLNTSNGLKIASDSTTALQMADTDGSSVLAIGGNRISKTFTARIGPTSNGPSIVMDNLSGKITVNTNAAGGSYFDIGTTTNNFNLVTLASTTAPQLSLSSGAGFAQLTQRAVNGNFYVATTSTSDTYATSSLAALTILQNGGFGIATNTPGTILSIGNNTGINFDISTSTFNTTGGININSGCFSVRSTCITGGTSATVDTGGFNFAYPFPNNATSTQLTFSAGLIATNASTTNFIATTTLGVATSTPGTPLGVTGAGTFTGQVEALNFYATSTTATSTFLGQISGNRVTAATARFTGLVSCDTIDSDLYGNLVCGTDATGAGGSVTGNGIAGMMTAWSSGSNLIGTSTIIGERFVATSTTAASSTIPNLALTNLQVTGNAEIGVPRYPWLSGMLLSVDSTGLTEATGTPTAGFFNATSTTASSTFQGLESNLLHVRSTTASSTFENGINLTKGCFAINSVCITGGAASSASTTLLSTDSNTFFGATTTFNLGLQANGYTNFAGTTTLTNNTLHTVENKLAGTSTTQVIDWAKGNFQTVGISTSAITMVFQNPTNGDGVSLLVCNASSGTAGTITWPNNVSWPGGIAPGQTTSANQCDLWSWRYSVGTSTPTVGSAKYFLTGLTSGYQ